jgi:raffinose/stachyose/melibiose transport system permease protein/N-acetylglucosamine transport system permease protein
MKKNLKSPKILRTRGEKILLSLILVIFIAYAFTLLYPFFWAAYNSLKSGREFNGDQFALPQVLHWDNYTKAFSVNVNASSILTATFNSIWITVVSTFCGIAVSAITAYVVAKYRFRGASLIYAVAVFIQIIPIVGSLPARYELYYDTLEIANKPWIYWVTWCGGFDFAFLMLYSGFKNLSWTYAEAAFIDGATDWQVFIKIMLPMAKGPILAIGIMAVISGWNNYTTPILYLDKMPTLASGLYYFNQAIQYVDNKPAYFAGVIMTMIPALVLFSISSNRIMGNVVMGGLKG